MKSCVSTLARQMAATLFAACLCLIGSGGVFAANLKLGGTGGALATMQQLADAYGATHPDVTITVLPSLGSSGGIKAVLAGAIQIAVSSRPIKDAELKQGAVVVEYGRTPFVFVTSNPGSVDEISTAELVEIYAGRTANWPDGSRIRLVMRPAGDSDSEMVKGISPAMRQATMEAEARKGMLFAISDQEAADELERSAGALGTSTLAQILSERRDLKPLRLDGAAASPANVGNGSYPLSKPMYLVTAPASPREAQDFVSFVRSPAGRKILERTGHWVP